MLKAYASYFASYLLANVRDAGKINKIILFGSIARGDATKESDTDIFVDVKTKNKKFELEIRKILENFYKSREVLLFKAKGIDNKINLIIGKIEEWKDLKESIESTGIILYGKFVSSGIKGRKYAIISWERIEKNRGAFLNKVYGFTVNGKKYKGLAETFGGRKIGKSSIMIPIEHRDEILRLGKNYGVVARVIEVWA